MDEYTEIDRYCKARGIDWFVSVWDEASVGLVGNDKLGGERFLYLPDGYETNLDGTANVFQHWVDGYNFGVNSNYYSLGVSEKKIGNPDVSYNFV